jgi:hypothetical protein
MYRYIYIRLNILKKNIFYTIYHIYNFLIYYCYGYMSIIDKCLIY